MRALLTAGQQAKRTTSASTSSEEASIEMLDPAKEILRDKFVVGLSTAVLKELSSKRGKNEEAMQNRSRVHS